MDLCRTERVSVVLRRFFLDEKVVKRLLDVLEVGHVARGTDYGGSSDCMKTSNVLEACKRTIGSYRGAQRGIIHLYVSNEDQDIPRLSAAIIIPSLYLMASTLVPVTMGCLHQIIIRNFQYTLLTANHKTHCVCCTPSLNTSFGPLEGLW